MKKIKLGLPRPRIRKAAIVPFLLGGLVTAGGMEGYDYVYGTGGPSLLDRLNTSRDSVAAADSGAVAAAVVGPDSLPAMTVDTLPVAADSAAAEPATTPAMAGAMPTFASTLGGDTLAGGDRLPKRRLAKLFGSMQAREAARVLEKMSDGEVEVILAQLGDREAASILSNLTPERAAQISQLVISGVRSSP